MTSLSSSYSAPQDQVVSETAKRTSDEFLLREFVRGRDETAFAELVGRHRQTVWNVCRRILQQDQDAEDAFQAVFLVLARKAASIAKVDAVGSWLYGVAYRTAMKARQNLAIRNVREKETMPSPAEQAAWSAAACRELQRILDEEVVGLPVKYRAPFILCCLQGMSKPEAAQELGWKEGTVSSRLANARKLLQSKLARRGVALTAALTATALAPGYLLASTASLSVPFTVQAVLAPVALKAGAGVASVSPAATTLASGIIQTMTIAKVKAVGALLIGLAVLAGGASIMMSPMRAPREKTPVAGAALGLDEALVFQPPGKSLWPMIEEDVLGLAITPDQTKLITTGSHSTKPCQLFIWDLESGKKLVAQKAIPGTRCIAMAPDGKTFACGEFGGTIRLRSVETGEAIGELKGHAIGVNGLAFSADGRWLASGGLDKIVKIWDWKQGSERWSLAGHTDMVYTIAISKSGKIAASGGKDRTVRVWDLEKGQQKLMLRGHEREIEAIAISSDETTIATGSWEGVIMLWDARTGSVIDRFLVDGVPTPFGSMINTLAFSPKDDDLLASATSNAVVQIWDRKTKRVEATIGEHRGAISSLVWAPDGKTLISGSADKTAKRWDVANGKLLQTYHNANRAFYPVTAMAQAPDGKTVAIATTDKIVRLHDVLSGDILMELMGHAEIPNSLAYSSDGAMLASGDRGGIIKLWDAASGLEKRSLHMPKKAVVAGETTRSRGENKPAVDVLDQSNLKGDAEKVKEGEWEIPSRQTKTDQNRALDTLRRATRSLAESVFGAQERVVPVEKSEEGLQNSLMLAFSPDDKELLVANGENSITRWDIATGTEADAIKSSYPGNWAMALSADGATLVLGNEKGKMEFFDLASRKRRLEVEAHKGAVRALAASSTGMVASGGEDGLVKVWDLASGALVQSYQDRRGECQSLVFSPGGRLLAHGGRGGDLIVRDLISGRVCGVVFAHDAGFRAGVRLDRSGVTGLVFDPDGQSMLSCGTDRKVLRWTGLPTINPIVSLPGHAGGNSFAQFSPGGERFAAGGATDGTVTLWSKTLMPAKPAQHERQGTYWDVAYSPEGSTVAVGSQTQLILMDAARGNIRRTINVNQPVCTVAFAPDGKKIALGTGDWAKPEVPGDCVIFDAWQGKMIARINGHKQRLLRVQFSPDGTTLATSCRDKIIRLWDAESGKLKGEFPEQQQAAKGMVYLPDGRLVTAGYDATIRFLDPATLKETRRIPGGMAMASLAVSPDGKMLITAESSAVGSGPGRIVLWNVAAGKEIVRLKGHDCRILGVAFTPDGRGVVAAGGTSSSHGEINYWDLESGEHRASKRTPTNWIDAVAVSPDGLKVASASVTGLHFWNLSWTHREREWAAHTGGVTAGLFADQGRTLITGGKDRTIAFWETRSGNQNATLSGHKGPVRALAHDAQGKFLCSAGEDGMIKVWDFASKNEIMSFQAQQKLACLAVAPDGNTIASGGARGGQLGSLVLWDQVTRQAASPEMPVEGAIGSLAYSPDGTMLAGCVVTDQGGMIVVWDAKTKKVLVALPVKDVQTLAFSSDSKVLTAAQGAGGKGHGKIWVWETVTWQGRPEFNGHTQVVAQAAFSPDGGVIASAGADETIALWPLGDRDFGVRGRPSGYLVGSPTTVDLALPSAPDGQPRSRSGIPVWTGGNEGGDGAAPGSRLKTVLTVGAVAAVGLFGFAGLVAYRQSSKKRKAMALANAAEPTSNSAPAKAENREASLSYDPRVKTDSKPSSTDPARTMAIPCSGCGKTLKGTEGLIGKKVKCPHCQAT